MKFRWISISYVIEQMGPSNILSELIKDSNVYGNKRQQKEVEVNEVKKDKWTVVKGINNSSRMQWLRSATVTVPQSRVNLSYDYMTTSRQYISANYDDYVSIWTSYLNKDTMNNIYTYIYIYVCITYQRRRTYTEKYRN